MLQDGYTGASCFSDVKRRAIPPEHLDGRPFRKHRERRRRVRAEFLCRVDNLSAYDREYGFDAFDVLFGDGKVIIGKHSEVSELAWGKGAFLAGLTREPTAALRVKPQGLFATEAIPLGIHRGAADCLSGDQPIQGNPGIIAGDSSGVCSGSDGDSKFEHFANWRRSLSGLFAIAVDEVFTLVSHAVLDRDASTECLYPLEVSVGDSFAMIEKPVQPFERHVTVYFLIYIEKAVDAFVISGVDPEWPFVGGQQRHNVFQLAFKRRREIGSRLQEVFKIGGRKYEHFACAIAAKEIVALSRTRHFDPARKVFLLLLRFLGEKIVSDAKSQLAALVQLLDDSVILRIVLEAASGVNDAGQAQTVQFTHEMPGGIHLMLGRQFGTFGKSGIKNCRIRARDEQPGRIAFAVVLNFPAGWVGRVLGITTSAESGLVQQGAAIQVQDEY